MSEKEVVETSTLEQHFNQNLMKINISPCMVITMHCYRSSLSLTVQQVVKVCCLV